MNKKEAINIKGTQTTVISDKQEYYISLTDMPATKAAWKRGQRFPTG